MMKDKDCLGLKGPVLVELCRSFEDNLGRLDTISDTNFYRDITFAVRLRYATNNFSTKPASRFDKVAWRVLGRLRQGWFADLRLATPQAWFAEKGLISDIVVRDSSEVVMGDKPTGALWTSSYLPTGHSTWDLLERAEFSHKKRNVFSIHFAEPEALVYTIDSLADYQQLVERYPNPVSGGRVCVRWSAVAGDFHAVHLTTRGLVLAHDVDLKISHGVARLYGWDSESTAWLRQPPNFRVAPNLDYPAHP